MQFLINRFNEKYPKQTEIHIKLIDNNMFSIKQIRYNQGGTACYCMNGQTQGKLKNSNSWKTIECTEECQYRKPVNENSKPACNREAILKFILPAINSDRLWFMRIRSQESISNLEKYFKLQKKMGYNITGDYILFLTKKEQITKQGKSFNNFILDIVKKEDFNSNHFINEKQINPIKTSTQNINNVNNSTKNAQNTVNKRQETKQEEKEIEKTKNIAKKTVIEKKQENNQKSNDKKEENATSKNEFENYFVFVETKKISLMKEGKPTEYLTADFVDSNDKITNVIIPPQLEKELNECELGTTVILDLKTAGEKIFANSIKYVQKLLKNVAA